MFSFSNLFVHSIVIAIAHIRKYTSKPRSKQNSASAGNCHPNFSCFSFLVRGIVFPLQNFVTGYNIKLATSNTLG
jgi:hypothetical protein